MGSVDVYISSEVDREIDESIQDCDSLKFTHKVNKAAAQGAEIEFDSSRIQPNNMYVIAMAPFEKLKIKIENNSLMRLSCAAHKLNLALRHAFELDEEFSSILTQLNRYCSGMRNSNGFKQVGFLRKKGII